MIAVARHRISTRLIVAAATALLYSSAATAADPEPVRRLLRLLHGIEQEYREAFDEQGALVRPIELEEARFLLVEAGDVTRAIGTDVPDAGERVRALAQAIAERAPVTVVTLDCRNLREAITRVSGVEDDVLPPQPPSAERGAPLYATHCVSCHGVRGGGDGPDAARLKRPPPDFTDPEFMSQETPADFFLVISLGRRGGEMPAWEDVLSVQERWDLVTYIWSLSDAGSDHQERVAATLVRVEAQLADAVSAYRLKEGGASALAMDAYLLFEPLEGRIAARDRAAVARVEEAFVRLHKALRLPDAENEVDLAASGVRSALAAVGAAPGAAGSAGAIIAGVLAAVGIVIAVLFARRRGRGARRTIV